MIINGILQSHLNCSYILFDIFQGLISKNNRINYFSILRKMVGNTINKSGNAIINPPIIAMANGWCICAPVPMPKAKGRRAIIAPNAVISVGRSLFDTA